MNVYFSKKRNIYIFPLGKDYLEFVAKISNEKYGYSQIDCLVAFVLFLIILRGEIRMGGRSSVTTIRLNTYLTSSIHIIR